MIDVTGLKDMDRVHCESMKEARALMEALDAIGAVWNSGDSLIGDRVPLQEHGEDTCYILSVSGGKIRVQFGICGPNAIELASLIRLEIEPQSAKAFEEMLEG